MSSLQSFVHKLTIPSAVNSSMIEAMFLIVCGVCFALSILMNIAEAFFDRDWPRATIRYTVAFGVILLIAAAS
jgi:hypothetical protein